MKRSCMFFLCFLLSTVVFAHGDHVTQETIYSQKGIPIEIEQAQEFSRYIVTQFVQEGRLDKSWNEARFIEAKTQVINDVKEWKVSYFNSKEKVDAKKTIYVFLDEFGNPFGVNFTGE